MIYENYIVGFLNIDFKNDITYKILITESNGKNYKMPLFTSVKHYMSKYNIDGLHTIIYDLSNKEISQEIKNAVNSIISSSEYKKYKKLYLKLRIFNIIIKNINLLGIKRNIQELKGKKND